jgi:hypothetical protein
MLAELSAANAAFAIIKQAVQNSGDIARAGSAVAKFVSAKEDIENKLKGKHKASAGGSDLERFMALEAIKQQEKELKEIMIYMGRPKLWSDWQTFQAECRKERREADLKAYRKKQFIIEVFVIIVAVVLMVAVAGTAAYLLRG